MKEIDENGRNISELLDEADDAAERQDYATAMRFVDRAIDWARQHNKPKATSIYLAVKGRILLDAGSYRTAEQAVRRSLEIAPRNPHALVLMGLLRQRQGDWRGATEWFERALGVREDDALLTLLASTELEFSPERALEHSLKALSLKPGWEEAEGIRAAAQAQLQSKCSEQGGGGDQSSGHLTPRQGRPR